MWLLPLFICAMMSCVALTSCGDDEPESPKTPDIPDVNPNTPVADPDGTISLSMHNASNGGTMLDDLSIGRDNNFHTDTYSMIVDCGEISGLGNIQYIPNEGWAREVQVKPSHGYVLIHYSHMGGSAQPEFQVKEVIRIYVQDWITNTMGEIIGADIKYQAPFNPASTLISSTDNIVISKDSPIARVNFINNMYVPIKNISIQGLLCYVHPIIDESAPFIVKGLDIEYITDNPDVIVPNDIVGKIIIETESKKYSINVTQKGVGDVFTCDEDNITFTNPSQNSAVFAWHSNIPQEEISIDYSLDWVKIEREGLNGMKVYVSTNCNTFERDGFITIKARDIVKKIKIAQPSYHSVPSLPEQKTYGANGTIGFDLNEDCISLGLTGDNYMNAFSCYLKIEGNITCNAGISSWNEIRLRLEANNTNEVLSGDIKLMHKQNPPFDDCEVTHMRIIQEACK